jgi:hypothetical protein
VNLPLAMLMQAKRSFCMYHSQYLQAFIYIKLNITCRSLASPTVSIELSLIVDGVVIGQATIPISPHSAEEWYMLKNNSIDTDIRLSLFQKPGMFLIPHLLFYYPYRALLIVEAREQSKAENTQGTLDIHNSLNTYSH